MAKILRRIAPFAAGVGLPWGAEVLFFAIAHPPFPAARCGELVLLERKRGKSDLYPFYLLCIYFCPAATSRRQILHRV
ncbi:hypothetical protein SDC9_154991 [bioreactor metagenome]|uniref:Uncharacterized protein n=1 Tax=bioreactor metagenome TaxID=1076179 RepID=A0A645F1S6_9ZZZZ